MANKDKSDKNKSSKEEKNVPEKRGRTHGDPVVELIDSDD